ncbi:MAG: NUDIX domain-containing protein [Methyloligellaceae bacterium]
MMKYPDWIYRQSAVLPYRRCDEGLEILLITSRKGKRWVLPKGIVEPGLTPPASAAKEAKEEAGIEGEVWAQSLGNYNYRKWGGNCEVDVFPMQVTVEQEDWPEAAMRRRKWLPVKKAARRIDEGKLSKLVRRLPDVVNKVAGADTPPLAETTTRPHVIYLFRHAKSSWDDPTLDDIARPLAPRGQRASETMRD